MSTTAPVNIAINATTNVSAVEQTSSALEGMRRSTARAGDEWDKLGRKVQTKFSLPDLGREVLMGLGIGSGFAAMTMAVGKAVDAWKQADVYAASIEERAKRIDEAFSNIREKSLAIFRSRQSPLDQKAGLTDDIAELKKQADVLEAQRVKALAAISELNAQAGGQDITNWSFRIGKEMLRRYGITDVEIMGARTFHERMLAQAEDAQTKHGAISEKILSKEAERDATKKQIAADEVKVSADAADASRERIAAANEQIEANSKIEAAQKRVNDAFRESADKYRDLADPQLKYKQQLQEIDALTKISGANGKPFLSAQDAAAAKARVLAEMNDLAGKAIRATRAEVEAYDFALEALDKNPALSNLEKQRERLRLIEEQTAAIRRAQQALTDFQQANPGVDVGGITSALVSLGDKAARNAGLSQPAQTLAQRDAIAQRDLGDPGKHYQSAGAGLAGGLAQQATSIGTLGDQVARGWANAGDSIRSSWGATISDMILRASSLKDAVLGFGSAIVTGFIGAGAQMVADWLYQHTVMAGIKSLFKSKDIAETTAAEGAKTAVTAAGEATRTGIVASAAAANTTVVTAEAGVIAGATGVAGVFRSIMELGPIAGPAVFATSVAAMIALVASLAQGFAEGGIVRGPGTATSDSIVARLSNGEAVLNARATAMLGEDFVHRANAGALDLMALSGQIGSHLPAAADAAMGSRSSGGGSAPAAAAAPVRIYALFDRSEFARMMQEDSESWFQDMSKTFQRKNA